MKLHAPETSTETTIRYSQFALYQRIASRGPLIKITLTYLFMRLLDFYVANPDFVGYVLPLSWLKLSEDKRDC